MFNKKLKNKVAYLELEIEQLKRVTKAHWDWISAMKETSSTDRKDLNLVIGKLNKLMNKTETKTKGKK